MKKLGIGIPVTNRNVDRDFFLSFAAMTKPEHYVLLAPYNEIYGHPRDIADARNSIVSQAIAEGCDMLIMMDTDQVYPPDTIVKIVIGLESFDAFGGVVHRRYPPFNALIMRGELGRYERVPDAEVYSGDTVQVDATGCGCLGFNMRAFQEIPPPWFELRPGDSGKPVGEDIRFCSKMADAGMTLGIDTSLQIDHLTTFRVNRGIHELFERFEQWQATNQARTAR